MEKKVILMVEDDPLVFKTINEYLSDVGQAYELLNATNGHLACKIAHSVMPDLILVSWGLLGMSGLDIVRQLKENPVTKNIPMIVTVEASVSIDDLNIALSYPLVDYIKKPTEKTALKVRMEMAIALADSLKETKQTKEAIISRNQFIVSLMDITPSPMFYQGENGLFLDCNRNFELLVKKEKKEIIGKMIYDVFTKSIADVFDKKFIHLMKKPGNAHFEMEMPQEKKSSKCFMVFYSTFYNYKHSEQGPSGCVCAMTDITEIVKYDMQTRSQLEIINKQNKQIYRHNIEKMKAELDFKQREMSTHVSLLIHSEKEKERLLEEINSLNSYVNEEGKKKLNSITRRFKQELNDDSWLNFETKFQEINFSFFALLEKKYPEITKNEKKLCAYLKMNLSSVEIAKITNKSLNSINVALARLRTKLNISSNKEIKTFLSEL